MVSRFIMKKCPFFVLIIFSVAVVAIFGLFIKSGLVYAGNSMEDANNESKTIEVASAVHYLKSSISTALGITSDDYPDMNDIMMWTPPSGAVSKNSAKEGEDDEIVQVGDNADENPVEIAKEVASDEEYANNPEGFVRAEGDGASAVDYGEFITVGDDYFEAGDACFIGDSRMQGFCMYSGLENITSYAQKSYAIYTVFNKAIFDTPTGKATLLQEMEANAGRFKKVYIMFGINEMGWADEEKFDLCYYQLIDMIKYYQPEAVIYVHSVIHVTKEKAESSDRFTNESVDRRNAGIKEVAENEHVAYLDLNTVFNDEEGYLPKECTSDGVHIKADYMDLWVNYLKTHAIAVK